MTPSTQSIIHHVAASFDITVTVMMGRRRDTFIVRPRQVAMYLAATMTGQSYPALGRLFGNRDHTTVMHAVKRVRALSKADAAFARRVTDLKISVPANHRFGAVGLAENTGVSA